MGIGQIIRGQVWPARPPPRHATELQRRIFRVEGSFGYRSDEFELKPGVRVETSVKISICRENLTCREEMLMIFEYEDTAQFNL